MDLFWLGTFWMATSGSGHSHVRGIQVDGTAWEDWVAIQPSMGSTGTPQLNLSEGRIGYATVGCESGTICSTWGGIIDETGTLIDGLHELRPSGGSDDDDCGTAITRTPDGSGWFVAWSEDPSTGGALMIVHMDTAARATTDPLVVGSQTWEDCGRAQLVTVCGRVALLWREYGDLMMVTIDETGGLFGPITRVIPDAPVLFKAVAFRNRIAVVALDDGALLMTFIDPVTRTLDHDPVVLATEVPSLDSLHAIALEPVDDEGFLVLAHSVNPGMPDSPLAKINLYAVDGAGSMVGSPLMIE